MVELLDLIERWSNNSLMTDVLELQSARNVVYLIGDKDRHARFVENHFLRMKEMPS